MNNSPNKGLLIVFALFVLAVFAWGFLTMPDQRTTGQKVGDAIDALPQGPGKAAEQLQDQTPGQKLGNTVEDAGNNIKRNTANPNTNTNNSNP